MEERRKEGVRKRGEQRERGRGIGEARKKAKEQRKEGWEKIRTGGSKQKKKEWKEEKGLWKVRLLEQGRIERGRCGLEKKGGVKLGRRQGRDVQRTGKIMQGISKKLGG